MLRAIDVNDAEVTSHVIAIQRASYQVEAELIGFDGIPQLHETADDIRGLNLHWLGSYEDEQLAGIIAWCDTSDGCDIDRLAVHPDFFRRGHGRRLVTSLAHHGVVTVSTGTDNRPACRLYESLGFVPTHQREILPGVRITEFRRAK